MRRWLPHKPMVPELEFYASELSASDDLLECVPAMQFGDCLMALFRSFLIVCQFRTRCRFSHDAVRNAIPMQRITLVIPKIAFIGEHLFDRVFGGCLIFKFDSGTIVIENLKDTMTIIR